VPTPLWLQVLYVPFLLGIAWSDARRGLIPNQLVVPLLLVALIVAVQSPAALETLITGLGTGLFFLIPVVLFGPRRAGAGDMKLAVFIALTAGWPLVLMALIIAFALAAIYAGIGLIAKRLTPRDLIPFGPFLVLGALAVFLLPG
jgi:prepilin signal peptidase PulO-like enzyme (type II secretory pathway)